MPGKASGLMVGELIEIKYRAARPLLQSGANSELIDRWIPAQIVHRDDNSFPIAQLADGQFTDIREFMTWRRLSAGCRGMVNSSH